jgi:hypothetical protein
MVVAPVALLPIPTRRCDPMVDVNDFDLAEEGASAPSDKLEVLHKQLDEATALEELLEQLNADASAAQSTLNALKTKLIPETMLELQMSELTRNGWKVKIADFVSGSLPKEEGPRQKAIDWLEKHEGGALIKTEISLTFAKSQHEEAKKLAERLAADGFAAEIASGVHASTLQAFARERLKNGEAVDTEVLGLYTGQVAKIDKVKEKKPK